MIKLIHIDTNLILLQKRRYQRRAPTLLTPTKLGKVIHETSEAESEGGRRCANGQKIETRHKGK
jgi:hypothetical protein